MTRSITNTTASINKTREGYAWTLNLDGFGEIASGVADSKKWADLEIKLAKDRLRRKLAAQR